MAIIIIVLASVENGLCTCMPLLSYTPPHKHAHTLSPLWILRIRFVLCQTDSEQTVQYLCVRFDFCLEKHFKQYRLICLFVCLFIRSFIPKTGTGHHYDFHGRSIFYIRLSFFPSLYLTRSPSLACYCSAYFVLVCILYIWQNPRSQVIALFVCCFHTEYNVGTCVNI